MGCAWTLEAPCRIGRITERIEVSSSLTRGTGGLLGALVDLVRRQFVRFDVLVMGAIDRLRHADRRSLPAGPPRLVGAAAAPGKVSGRFAGPVSRLLDCATDLRVLFGSLAAMSAALTCFVQLVSGYHLDRGSPPAVRQLDRLATSSSRLVGAVVELCFGRLIANRSWPGEVEPNKNRVVIRAPLR